MKRSTTSSTPHSNPSSCSHISSAGRRCRMASSPGSPYCHSHAKNTVIVASSLASELSRAAGTLAAPEDVNRVLAKIFLALAEDRLSTRKAAVLGYIGQMLLRSHREIAFHKKLANDEAAETERHEHIVIDIPGMTPDIETPAVTPPQPEAVSAAPPESSVSETPLPTPKPNSTTKPATDPSPFNPSDEPSQPIPPLPDLNHFYPNVPSLQPTFQRPTASPPDEEELRQRELNRRYVPNRRRW